MFGGGTEVEVHLDATQVPVGGVLSGRAIVKGGKKDLELDALKVRLLYVSVQSNDDSPMPDIDTRILIDNTITTNQPLPAGSTQEYTFQLPIPDGTEPSAHNVSYKVLVAADIPKVKDPTAEAKLKVVEASVDGDKLASLDEIYSRWPALRGAEPRPLIDALHDFRNECYGERETLIIAEPILAGLVRRSTGDVRRAAIEAWANLLDEQVRPENLKLLEELAASDLDLETTKEVVEAAAKFADEGAMLIIAGYAQHSDAEIRERVASALRFASWEKYPGKKELVLGLCRDPDPSVRSAAFGAIGDFNDDPQVAQMCAAQIDHESSPDVQAAMLDALAFAHHHGLGDLTFSVYERQLQNPHERVRLELADNLHCLPSDQPERVGALARALLSDASPEVRRKTAWQFRNLRDFPTLAPLLQHAIENDPDPEVRLDGLGALSSVIAMSDAVAYYQARMQQEPTEKVYRAVLDGVRWRDEPEAKQMLQALAGCEFVDVARRARSALES